MDLIPIIFSLSLICFSLCIFILKDKIAKKIEQLNMQNENEIETLSLIGIRLRMRGALLQERLKKELRKEIYKKYIVEDFILPEAYPPIYNKESKNRIHNKKELMIFNIGNYLNIISYYEDLLYFFTGVDDDDEKFDIHTIYEDTEAELAIEILSRQKNIDRINRM